MWEENGFAYKKLAQNVMELVKQRGLALVLSFTIVSILLVGCGSTPTEGGYDSGNKVIKIGVFQPLTGEHGEGGYQEALGIRYGNFVYPTVDIGEDTYDVKLVEVDNKSNTDVARTTAQSLVDSDVSLVIGSYSSSLSIAGNDIFLEENIPVIAPSATNPQVTLDKDNYFRVCFLDTFQGAVIANYAFEKGAKTAAVITQEGDEYSTALGEYFATDFKKIAGDNAIVADENFQANEVDFEVVLSKVKEANPDVIFIPSSIETAVLILNQAGEMGITSTIMSGDTWENMSIVKNSGDNAEGIIISTFYEDSHSGTEEESSFVPGFKEYLRANRQPDTIYAVSALGYDAYLVALDAIKQAGSTDTTAIRDALAKVELEGVTGPIAFDDNGDAKKDTAFIMTVKNGAFEFVETTTIE